jgi:hypothetical protein
LGLALVSNFSSNLPAKMRQYMPKGNLTFKNAQYFSPQGECSRD